jgi:hypothetical protein
MWTYCPCVPSTMKFQHTSTSPPHRLPFGHSASALRSVSFVTGSPDNNTERITVAFRLSIYGVYVEEQLQITCTAGHQSLIHLFSRLSVFCHTHLPDTKMLNFYLFLRYQTWFVGRTHTITMETAKMTRKCLPTNPRKRK